MPRPKPTSLAYLAGWLIGLAALTAIFVAFSDALGVLRKSPPAWASWLRVGLGLALIAYGIYEWLARHRHTGSPKWMRPFATLRSRVLFKAFWAIATSPWYRAITKVIRVRPSLMGFRPW